MWDTYDALKSKTKEKNKRGKNTHKPVLGPLETGRPYSFAAASSALPVCTRTVKKRGAHTHTCAIGKEKIEYHPELEEHDSKELVIFSALQKSLI